MPINNEIGFPRRILVLILLMLVWTMVLNAASAFSTGDQLEGVLEAIVAVVLIAVLVDGRVSAALAGRPINKTVIPILILIEFVILYGELPRLFGNEITVQGEVYLPGFLTLIHSIGSVLLAFLLGWETVKLATRTSANG